MTHRTRAASSVPPSPRVPNIRHETYTETWQIISSATTTGLRIQAMSFWSTGTMKSEETDPSEMPVTVSRRYIANDLNLQ